MYYKINIVYTMRYFVKHKLELLHLFYELG